jgi:hypothetical protein
VDLGPYVYLSALFVVPGLLGLMLLMEWLEHTFARRFVADDIARLLHSEAEIEDLEARVASTAQPLFGQLTRS